MKTQFNPAPITGDDIADAALDLEGIKYGKVNSVFYNKNHNSWQGKLNCFGLAIQIAKMKGLVDSDFDLNLSPALFGQEREKTLTDILRLNFDRIKINNLDKTNPFEAGDILLGQWNDVSPSLDMPHHLYIHIGHFEREYYGWMIHAHDKESGGTGYVTRQPLTILDFSRIVKAFRIKRMNI